MTPDELAAIVARDAGMDLPGPNERRNWSHHPTDSFMRAHSDRRALLAWQREVRAEYQRFYDFVAESDPALVDAWHFTENARLAGVGA